MSEAEEKNQEQLQDFTIEVNDAQRDAAEAEALAAAKPLET